MVYEHIKKGWGIKEKNSKAHYFNDQVSNNFSICGRVFNLAVSGKGRVGLCKFCVKKRKKMEHIDD